MNLTLDHTQRLNLRAEPVPGPEIVKTLKTLQENHETQRVPIRPGVALCQTLLYFGWRERML